jgi:hypothetical protein
MPIKLPEKLTKLLKEPGSKKALSSIGKDGVPHTVFKDSIQEDAEGNIRYCELIETSQTNKNLTHSMWFHHPISINVLGEDGESWQIIGTPVRALISGPEFEQYYISARNSLEGESDLSTVWIIEPEKVKEETYETRLREQTERYPLVGHLDRYLK